MAKLDLAAAFDTSNLDQNNPGSWPIGIKGITFLFIFGGIVAAGIFFDAGFYRPITLLAEDLKKSEQKLEKELKPTFESKAALAANLDAYKAQLAEMERSFGARFQPHSVKALQVLKASPRNVDKARSRIRPLLDVEMMSRPKDAQPIL